MFNLVKYSFITFIGAFLITLAIGILYKWNKNKWAMLSKCGYYPGPGLGALVGSFFALLIGSTTFFFNVFTTIELYFAPKVWLLEYATSQVRGHI